MSDSTSVDLKDYIRDVPDFPKPGINFKDITPLLADGEAFRAAISMFANRYRDMNVDNIVAAEARGFIFAAPLAVELGVGKPGKLPYERHSLSYELEYGTDTLEMHIDGVEEGQRVLIIDDLLATGGTVGACCQMVKRCKAEVIECAFLVELDFLEGRQRLDPCDVFSLIHY